jgi:hypothetical protein
LVYEFKPDAEYNLYIIMRKTGIIVPKYQATLNSEFPLGDPFTENQDLYERLETGGV